jgi:hypothetical protein
MTGATTIATQAWRPQGFGKRHARDIADPIIEPLWAGERVLLVVNAPGARPAFLDEEGELLDDPLLDLIVDQLGKAIRADSLVLDGYLTRQPHVKAEMAADLGLAVPTPAQMVGQMFFGRRAAQAARLPIPGRTDPIDRSLPLAFVAVDLLAVDDEPLLDIPLLERKRILETVFAETDLLRRTAFVRPPIEGWLVGWRAIGFRQLAYKAANSRYTPGLANPSWASARIPTG